LTGDTCTLGNYKGSMLTIGGNAPPCTGERSGVGSSRALTLECDGGMRMGHLRLLTESQKIVNIVI